MMSWNGGHHRCFVARIEWLSFSLSLYIVLGCPLVIVVYNRQMHVSIALLLLLLPLVQ